MSNDNPKLVLESTYGEPCNDDNGVPLTKEYYDNLAEEIWDESLANVNASAEAYEKQREAHLSNMRDAKVCYKPFEPAGNAKDYKYMSDAFHSGHYSAETFLMLAAVYENECDDHVGAELIRQFAREFSRREVTMI